MPSGGARARSGPAPDPNALRRDRKDDASWLTLPAEGRTSAPPAWPFPTCTDRELELWAALWRKPVAVLWERDRQDEYVALYVRSFVEAEGIGGATGLRTLVKQLAGELLLTMPAMLAARIRIAPDEVGEKRDEQPAKASARDRMKVVSSGDGA